MTWTASSGNYRGQGVWVRDTHDQITRLVMPGGVGDSRGFHFDGFDAEPVAQVIT